MVKIYDCTDHGDMYVMEQPDRLQQQKNGKFGTIDQNLGGWGRV